MMIEDISSENIFFECGEEVDLSHIFTPLIWSHIFKS